MNLENLALELGLENDEFLEVAQLYVEACASDFDKLQSAIDDANARFIEIILQKDGYQAVTSYDAAMGLETLADRSDIQLIIADIVMPKVNGIELIEEIRKNAAWANIPIIMCSSLRDMETIEKALKSGCDDYMIKPIKKDALLEKIHAALNTGSACDGS
jgi:DNA-binding response OmpR family regulator